MSVCVMETFTDTCILTAQQKWLHALAFEDANFCHQELLNEAM